MKKKSIEVKNRKAWILDCKDCFYPTIFWKQPTEDEIKTAKEYGCEYYPCEIIYKTTPP